MKKAGINNFWFHCLRHTAITWRLERGKPPAVVGAYVGHKSLAMTQRYTHPSWESMKRMVEGNKAITILSQSKKREKSGIAGKAYK